MILLKGFAKLAKFTIKFVIENNLKFIFAGKREEGSINFNNEFEFYKKYLWMFCKMEYEIFQKKNN